MSNRKGRQYERLVAAVFRADGQFVERHRSTPRHRSGEMDLIAYTPRDRRLLSTLVECKCSPKSASVTDLFEARGRQVLVGADRAALVAAGFSQRGELDEIASRLGMTLVAGTDPGRIHEQLARDGLLRHDIDRGLVRHWLRAFEVEDACRTILQREARRARSRGSPEAAIAKAYSYLCDLEGVFWWRFPDPWSRAVYSYRVHRRYQRIAQDVALEYGAAGSRKTRPQHLRAAYSSGYCPPAQAALYVQTRARMTLAVLAAECALDVRQDRDRREAFLGKKIEFGPKGIPQELPQSYLQLVEGLYSAGTHAASHFPIILQAWETGWGGFLGTRLQRTEEQLIAEECGTTRRTFSDALDRLNRLFTVVGVYLGSRRDWFTVIPRRKGHEAWEVRTLKLLPEPWKGLGLARRLLLPKASQPEQPWPAYYARWQRQVDAYQDYLRQCEAGEAGADWRSIEQAVHGRLQSCPPPFSGGA